jgi:hypothetical protein
MGEDLASKSAVNQLDANNTSLTIKTKNAIAYGT